jgi:hypothetical protein
VNVPAELWSPEDIHGVTGGWLLVEGFLEHRREGRNSCPALRRDWRDDGIGLGRAAVELSTGEGGSATVLEQSYDVPSFEFARRFGLRQLPDTLDLVGFDGVRASATFRTEEPWRGQLLSLRRDLVVDFAGVEWSSVPPWVHAVHQTYEHVWRDLRVLDES